MKNDLAGNGIIVTGAASGIGRATARLLAAQGAQLSLWDLNAGALNELADELGAFAHVVDIANEASVGAALAETTTQLGTINAVIHSAGILRTGLFQDVSLEQHRAMVDVNLWGTLNVTHQVLPELIKSKGSLVLLGSISAFYGPPDFASYGSTKAAVLNFAQALRMEVEALGVHIGVCSPWFVDSPMVHSQPTKAAFVHAQGLSHTVDEVAKVVVGSLASRRFMIWPSIQPRWVYVASRLLFPLGHVLVRRDWRKGQRRAARSAG